MPDNNKLMEERLAKLEAAIENLTEIVAIGNKDTYEIKQAVIGDTKIGLNGLVKDMASMKKWRAGIDIRVASIAGGVTVLLFIAKLIFKI